MKFVTTKEINETQITHVILHRDVNDLKNERLYLFHCVKCGNAVVQYQGFVVQILPGLAPISLPIVARCNNSTCRQKYAFSALV